jgi:hypothetical protein
MSRQWATCGVFAKAEFPHQISRYGSATYAQCTAASDAVVQELPSPFFSINSKSCCQVARTEHRASQDRDTAVCIASTETPPEAAFPRGGGGRDWLLSIHSIQRTFRRPDGVIDAAGEMVECPARRGDNGHARKVDNVRHFLVQRNRRLGRNGRVRPWTEDDQDNAATLVK